MPLAVVAGATMPQPGEHGFPLCVSAQLTPPVLGSLATVGVICCVALTTTLAEVGETETEMAGTLMVAEADFVASATEVAVRVTIRSLAGGLDGAV